MLTIFKKEVSSYFNSLTGYLAIAIFLVVTGLVIWVFPDTSVLDTGYASLEDFFGIAPYLFMFLVPAVTMRAIAGEKSDGTYELLISRPIPIAGIVLGKFFGGLSIVVLSIFPTTVYAVTLYYLGNPVGNLDIGATIGSYLGLLLLACSYVSIGLFCSTLARNPIVSFLTAVFVCFCLYDGLESLSKLPLFSQWEDRVAAFGIRYHYRSISRGVLLATDVVYFLSLTGLTIIGSTLCLSPNFRKGTQSIRYLAAAIVAILLVNMPFFSNLFNRIDFTEDKRYTLSDSSVATVQNLRENIYITIFLEGKDLPASFRRLRKASVDMATDLRAYAGKQIHINVIGPLEGSEKERQEFEQALIERGLYPTNLSVRDESGYQQKRIYPWAIVGSDKNEVAVNLLQSKMGVAAEQVINNSIQNLEYAFVNAIRKTSADSTPFIGFTEGHGEPTDLELYDALQTLQTSNQVGRVNLDSVNYESLRKLKIMIIAKPKKAFSESDKYKIDYFVRHGGHVVWALDQVDADLEYLRQRGSQPLIGRSLNLDDMLFLYGGRFNYNLVADLNCTQIPLSIGNLGGQPQIELVPWYFFPILMPLSNHPIVKNLDGIRTEFIGTIDTVESANIQKEVLLTSSPFTRILTPPHEISLQMVEEQPDPTKFKTKPAAVAVLLKGHFPYIFQNRPAPRGITDPVDLTATSKASKMLMISDGDWLTNQISASDQSPFPLGWDRYTNQQFANKVFLENLVDYLLNDERLIQLRHREVKLRLLDQSKIKSEKQYWQAVNVLVPLMLLLITAFLQHYWRKRKFGRA